MTIQKLSVAALILVGVFGIAAPVEAQQMDCGVTRPYTGVQYGSWNMSEQLAIMTTWLGYWDDNGNWVYNHNAYTQPNSPFYTPFATVFVTEYQTLNPPYTWFYHGSVVRPYGWQTETSYPECSAACETMPGVDVCFTTTYGFCQGLKYRPGVTADSLTFIPSPPAGAVEILAPNTGGLGVSTCVPVQDKPDMTAGATSPVVASTGSATTFTATVSNVTVNAGASHTRFQSATSIAGADAATIADIATPAIAAGGSAAVSVSHTFATAGTYYMRACADTATAVDESNENNNCGAWTPVTVTSVAGIDLTAGAVTPTSADAGTATSFSALVTNLGGTSAGASQARFQRATDINGSGATHIANAVTAALTSGAGVTSSISYTFPSGGTYYMRACADRANVVAESNENNNCGAWTAIEVAGASVPAVSCSVSETSIALDGSVTYSTSVSGGAGAPYNWTASDGTIYGNSSTVTRSFGEAGPYNMSVTASGASGFCPQVSVGADWCTSGTPTLTISANPARVRVGQPSTITWSARGVRGQDATCTVTGPGISWSSAVSAGPVCSAGSEATVTINTQSTYTLACEGQSVSKTVNVVPTWVDF